MGKILCFGTIGGALIPPYVSWLQHLSPQEVLNDTFNNMRSSEGEWKWDRFKDLVPVKIVNIIRALFISNEEGAQDSVGWMGDLNKFSVKEALSLLQDKGPEPQELN